MRVHRLVMIGLVGMVGLAGLGCAAARNWIGAVAGAVTPTPTRTPRPPLPTFTPTPMTEPAAMPRPAAPAPMATPSASADAGNGNAEPTPAPQEPTPAPVATPFLVTLQGNVNIRSGPGTAYDVIGQLAPGQTIALTGRNALGDWWQVCCIQGQSGWMVDRLVQAQGPLASVAVVQDIPPTSTPRPIPSTNTPIPPPPPAEPTATPAPALKYMRVRGPEFYPNTNPVVTIWVKVYADPDVPLAGRELKVMRDGVEIGRAVSDAAYSKTSPSADFGFFEDANIKFERRDDVSASRWHFCLAEGGACVSPEMPFDVSPENTNRTVYVALRAN